jgi:hypothetical protein
MKAYKIELLVVDHENCGEDEIIFYLENVKYIYPSVMSIQSKDIGEWDDDHPLNKIDTAKQTYDDLFGDELK